MIQHENLRKVTRKYDDFLGKKTFVILTASCWLKSRSAQNAVKLSFKQKLAHCRRANKESQDANKFQKALFILDLKRVTKLNYKNGEICYKSGIFHQN